MSWAPLNHSVYTVRQGGFQLRERMSDTSETGMRMELRGVHQAEERGEISELTKSFDSLIEDVIDKKRKNLPVKWRSPPTNRYVALTSASEY